MGFHRPNRLLVAGLDKLLFPALFSRYDAARRLLAADITFDTAYTDPKRCRNPCLCFPAFPRLDCSFSQIHRITAHRSLVIAPCFSNNSSFNLRTTVGLSQVGLLPSRFFGLAVRN